MNDTLKDGARGSIDVTVDMHQSALGSMPFYRTADNPKVGYQDVLSLTGVPVQSGRRYRVTVEELDDSEVALKQNPWRPSEWS